MEPDNFANRFLAERQKHLCTSNSRIWHSRDVLKDSPVAIKGLKFDACRDLQDYFTNELVALQAFKEKNSNLTVKYIEHTIDGDFGMIALEWCDFGDLHDFLNTFYDDLDKNMSKDTELFHGVVRQMIDALDFVHRCDFIHGDVKPENYLIDASGTIKLCDFGFSVPINIVKPYQNGTVIFMAPEIFRKTETTQASDVWSLGVCIVELMSGEGLFDDYQEMEDIIECLEKLECQEQISNMLGKFTFDPLTQKIVDLCILLDSNERESTNRLAVCCNLQDINLELHRRNLAEKCTKNAHQKLSQK